MQLVDAVRARLLDPLDAAVAYQVAVAGLPLDRATKRLGLTPSRGPTIAACRPRCDGNTTDHSPTHPRPEGDRQRAGR